MATTVAVTDTKIACPQRGTRIKPSFKTADLTGVKLVSKNPAKPGTRFYAFVMAFIGKAKRVATVRQLVDFVWAHQDATGMPRDTEKDVLRDLANYTSAWLDHSKTGSRGYHLRCNRVDGTSVSNTALTAKYEYISWRKDSSFAEKARELGWPVA